MNELSSFLSTLCIDAASRSLGTSNKQLSVDKLHTCYDVLCTARFASLMRTNRLYEDKCIIRHRGFRGTAHVQTRTPPSLHSQIPDATPIDRKIAVRRICL